MNKGKIWFLLLILSFMFIRVDALECGEGNFEIIYNANKGKMTLPSECSNGLVTSVTPTRKGYAFLGWSETKSSVVNYRPGDNINVVTNTTLYAVWSKAFKVTFNANGGKSSKKNKTVYKGLSYGDLPKASKKGYEFIGWYTKKSGGDLVTPETIVSKGKKFTIYAHYNKITYTISYELNGGVNANNKTSYTVTNKFKLKNPSRSGYIFKGWYKSSNFKGKVTTVNKGTTGNKTYYAKWAAVKYNIKYVGNGGKGSTKYQKNLKYGTSYNLKNNWFTKKGYDFIGWNTKKDGSGTPYESGQSISNLSSKNGKTVTLYAQWRFRVTTYNIGYVLNGGINPAEAPTSYDGTSNVMLPVPTRKGYDFKGWYLEETFIHEVKSLAKGTTGHKTLYAYWVENEKEEVYTITYILNGGSNPSTAVSKYQSGVEVDLPIPSRDGFTFEGWYRENSFINKIEKINSLQSGNYTVYAKWKENVIPGLYTITYILNGGTNPAGAPTSYIMGTGTELPTPTRERSEFLGWYIVGTETKVTSIAASESGNKNLYAKWKFNDKKDYAFHDYYVSDLNTYSNKKELKLILYNILNNGGFDTTIYCNYSNCVNDFLSMMDDDTQEEITSIVNYVNPFNRYKSIYYSYSPSGNSGTINLHFNKKYDDSIRNAVNNAVDSVLNSIPTTASASDKVKMIHDYLINNNVYDMEAALSSDTSSDSFSAVGALLRGKAVCQGYAEAMALFLDRFGIPNLTVSSSNHIWNLVYVNGQWLHVDATWDDPITNTGVQVLRYTYFLKTSTELRNIDLELQKTDHVYNSNYYFETQAN